MFRKEPQTKALSNLKSSERRRLLSTITQLYDIPKECEEVVVPSVIKQTNFINAKGIHGVIYTDDDQTPLWFKTHTLIPSIYTCWKLPFLPLIKTHQHVLQVLENGADLMLPGTIPPFDTGKGVIVGVVGAENPTVVRAVGITTVDLSPLNRTIGTKGVAVEVYHTYQDKLFDMSKVKLGLPEEVNTLPVHLEEEEAIQEEEPVAENEEEVKEITDTMNSLTTEDIDHMFKRSLLQTLSLPIELPLQASTFMNHIVNNLPINTNIKKSSYKKSTKFIKQMEKDGFIKVKGKNDDLTIVSIANKDTNQELKNFVPYKVKSNVPKVKTSATPQLQLTKYYKPSSITRMMFNDMGMDYTRFYTLPELKEMINNYIIKHNLIQKNKRTVLLDDLLSSIIHQNTIDRAKIIDPFIKQFIEHYKITNPSIPDNSTPKRGSVPMIKIITETKIGRKLITRVSNLEPFAINAEELSNDLKLKCSGSSTIGQNPQNPKLIEVTVQGPHSKNVIDLLTKKYGLHSNWITFEDKSKKK